MMDETLCNVPILIWGKQPDWADAINEKEKKSSPWAIWAFWTDHRKVKCHHEGTEFLLRGREQCALTPRPLTFHSDFPPVAQCSMFSSTTVPLLILFPLHQNALPYLTTSLSPLTISPSFSLVNAMPLDLNSAACSKWLYLVFRISLNVTFTPFQSNTHLFSL